MRALSKTQRVCRVAWKEFVVWDFCVHQGVVIWYVRSIGASGTKTELSQRPYGKCTVQNPTNKGSCRDRERGFGMAFLCFSLTVVGLFTAMQRCGSSSFRGHLRALVRASDLESVYTHYLLYVLKRANTFYHTRTFHHTRTRKNQVRAQIRGRILNRRL